jgi:hypothetical protein
MYSFKWMRQETHGFAMYYTYARMVLEGEDFQRAFASSYFNSRIEAYGMSNITDMPNNPPTTAFIMIAISWLPPDAAKAVWTAVLLVLLVVSLRILLTLYGISLSDTLGAALTAFALLWRPVYENIAWGQAYLLLLFLFCVSLIGVHRHRPMLGSVPLSCSFVLKGYGIIPLLWFMNTGRWKEVAAFLGVVLIVLVLSLAVFDIGVWETYYRDVLSTMGTLPQDAHVAYQTINSLVNHLLTYDEAWLPSPLLRLPKPAAMSISILLSLSVIWYVARNFSTRTLNETLLSYSAAIATGVIVAPRAEEYHFVLFLPLTIGLAVTMLEQYANHRTLLLRYWIFLIAALVMCIPMSYREVHFSPAPLVLLGYPKLYAGAALLICFGRVMKKHGSIDGNAPRTTDPPGRS